MLRADRSGVPRVQADILRLPLPDGSVDGVTCGFALRNLVELPAFFDELAGVVRPGGRIALLDVGVPGQPRRAVGTRRLLRSVVPRIGGWLSDAAAYRYLPRSVAYLPTAGQLVAVAARRRASATPSHEALRGGITQLLTVPLIAPSPGLAGDGDRGPRPERRRPRRRCAVRARRCRRRRRHRGEGAATTAQAFLAAIDA